MRIQNDHFAAGEKETADCDGFEKLRSESNELRRERRLRLLLAKIEQAAGVLI